MVENPGNLLTKTYTEYILSTSKHHSDKRRIQNIYFPHQSIILIKGEESNVRRNEKNDRGAVKL